MSENRNLRIGGLQPGVEIGPFKVVRLLGKGGMGAVYLAEQKSPLRQVALKMMTKFDAGNRSQLQRFLQEAQLGARLDHPNIVKTYLADVVEDIPYLAMAYIEGKPLDEYARNLPPQKILEIVRSVALALDYAHGQGIVHRDVKPGNIFVRENGEPVVMDFGIACPMHAVDKRLTRTGTVLGTPQYMSPEQARGEKNVDVRADVYSLGAVLYELMTARPPFVGDNTMTVLYAVTSQAPVLPTQLNSDIPRQLENIILRCLEKDKTRRYRTSKQLADAIDKYMAGRKISWEDRVRRVRWRLAAHRKKLLVVAALLLLCLVLPLYLSQERRTARKNPAGETRKEARPGGVLWQTFQKFEKALQSEPSPAVYLEYLDWLHEQGLYVYATKVCDRAIELVKGDPETVNVFQNQKAVSLLRARRYRQSLWTYNSVRLLVDAEVALNRAEVHCRCHKYLLAKGNLDRAGTIDLDESQKKRYRLWLGDYNLGTALRRRIAELLDGEGKNQTADLLQQAEAHLQAAGAMPAHAGQLESEIRRRLWAVKVLQSQKWEEVQSPAPEGGDDFSAWETYAVAAFQHRDFTRAIEYCSRCIEQRPWDAVYYHLRGRARMDRGDAIDAVMDDCFRAMELQPDDLSPLKTYLISVLSRPTPQLFTRMKGILLGYACKAERIVEPNLWQNDFERMAAMAEDNYLNSPPTRLSQEELEELVSATTNTSSLSEFECGEDLLKTMWCDSRLEACLKGAKEPVLGGNLGRVLRQERDRHELESLLGRLLVRRDLSARGAIQERLPLLAEIFDNTEEYFLYRYWAARALTALPSAEAQRLFSDRFANADPVGRILCAIALKKAGGEVAVDAREVPNFPDSVIAFFLHHFPDRLPAAKCREFLASPDPNLRATTARALLHLGEALPEGDLAALLADNSPGMRPYLCGLLWDIPAESLSAAETISKSSAYTTFLTAAMADKTRAAAVAVGKLHPQLLRHQDSSGKSGPHLLEQPVVEAFVASDSMQKFHLLTSCLKMRSLNVFLKILGEHEFEPATRMAVTSWLLPARENALYYRRTGEVGDRMIAIYDKYKDSREPGAQFFLYYLYGILLDATFTPLIHACLNAKLKDSIKTSKFYLEKIAIAHAAFFGTSEELCEPVTKMISGEKDPSFQRMAAASAAYHMIQLRKKRPEFAQLHLSDDKMKGYPMEIRQGAAYAYSHCLEDLVVHFGECPDFDGSTAWGRDRKYLLELESALSRICRQVHTSRYCHFEELFDFYRNSTGHVRLLPQRIFTAIPVKIDMSSIRRCRIAREVWQLEQFLREAQDADPENADYYFESAVLLEFLGDYREALAMAEKAMSKNSRDIYRYLEARVLVKMSMAQQGETRQAGLQRAFQLLRQIREPDSALWELEGKIYSAEGKWAEAEQAFTCQYALDHSAMALILRGHSRLSMGRVEEARSDYALAIQSLQNGTKSLADEDWRRWHLIGPEQKFFLSAENFRARGEYCLGLARLAAMGKDYKQAQKKCRNGSAKYLEHSVHFGDSPFTRQNLQRYPEFGPLLDAPLLKDLPVAIAGLISWK